MTDLLARWGRLHAAVLAALMAAVAAGSPARAADEPQGRIAYVQTRPGPFQDGGGASDVHTIAADGTAARLVVRNAASPRWSPDGRRLAVIRRNDVYLVRADGTGLRRVTYGARTTEAAWSPDGRHLVLVRKAGRHTDLYRMPLTRPGYPSRVSRHAAGGCDVAHPDWRGMLIVIARRCAAGPTPDNEQLRVVNVGTRTVRTVLDTARHRGGNLQAPAFTADGSIMFTGCLADLYCAASRNVHTVDLDGGNVRLRTNSDGIDGSEHYNDAAPAPVGDGFVLTFSYPVGDPGEDEIRRGLCRWGEPTGCNHHLVSSTMHRFHQPDWQPVP